MRKPISTKAHGFLDYMTAGLLVTLPRAMGWSENVTRLLDASAAGTVAYSLLTRYELGVVKALPMTAHLAIDAVQGGALIGAAAFMEDEDLDVRATLAALGVFELGVTFMTRTQTAASEAEHPTTERVLERARDMSMPQAPNSSAGTSNVQRGFVAM